MVQWLGMKDFVLLQVLSSIPAAYIHIVAIMRKVKFGFIGRRFPMSSPIGRSPHTRLNLAQALPILFFYIIANI